ncbi:MAG: SDR family oxidoreductase [Alphaproteobacteria bacterium]|nr:MAG: SDR family oxidoreductase [Alphaproteobacteria bacterium]
MAFGDLTGLVALVTGGSRGIGRATAEMLKAHGAEVIIHGSSEETVSKAVGEMGVKGIVANLLDANSVEKIVSEAGQVDILINNAGITRDALFVRQGQQQWDEVMMVNVNRVVELSRAVLPGMMSKGYGRIVNMSSVVAHMGNVGQTNYIASKSAITGFTKALAKEVARKGVTVNAIAPGFINTDMTATIPDSLKEAFVKQIPAQRFGEANDIASAVAYLVSREAGYVTGTTIHVNGGMYV